MARAALAVQNMSVAGLTNITMSAPNGSGAGNGNTVAGYDQNTFILVFNQCGTTNTVTIPNTQTIAENGIVIPSATVAIPNGAYGIVWVPAQFYDDTTGTLCVDISTATTTTWAAIKKPPQYQ